MPMEALTSFVALAAAWLLALGYFPFLERGRPASLGAITVLGSCIALTPLLIPADARFARLVVACIAACLMVKLVDLHIGARRGRRVGLPDFLRHLANPVQLVERRTGCEHQPSAGRNLRDLLRSGVGMLLAFAALRWAGTVDWAPWPFLLQHAARATAFFVMVHFLFQHLAALLRLAGVYTVDPEDRPFLACTPAEFWRRYNRWMGQFLHENVFKQVGGRRQPVRATLLVFAVSGLLHEYIFLVAIGHVQGYQLAFFLLQGAAVASTLRIRPTGPAAVAWFVATWLFNVVSSVLFFASLQGVGPFYKTGLPDWLVIG